MTSFELLEKINKESLRTDLPRLEIGDMVEVVSKYNLASQRFLSFKGTVIGQKNIKQPSYTFKVLKEMDKMVFTSVFSYHSPFIISIKKISKAKVRRAKLYFFERKLSKKKDNI